MKTSRIGPADLNYHGQPKGAAPVQWFINDKWVHKGWLMPQIKPTEFRRGK